MVSRYLSALFALIALVVLAPLLIVVAITVRLLLGRPVFFIQERPGFHAKPFRLVKFRTMLNTYDSNGNLRPDSERLTGFGRFLRSSSLDELPELWNIVKGEMSFVGPRPLLMEYLPLYTERQRRRHDVKPGLTGWSQVNGRNALSWPERLELDAWYVEHRSFLLDCRIVFRTIGHVVRRRGISATGHETMPKFTTSEGAEA